MSSKNLTAYFFSDRFKKGCLRDEDRPKSTPALRQIIFWTCSPVIKVMWTVMPKEAWGFWCPGLPLAQTSRVWMLSLGVPLAPEQSGNLNLILSHGCLRFQEGCNVLGLSFVCLIIWPKCVNWWPTFQSYLPEKSVVSPEPVRPPAWAAPPYCGLTFYFWVEIKQKRQKTKHLFSMCAFLRFGFKILKPLPGG